MIFFEFEYPFAFILLSLIICIYKCPLSVKRIIFPHLNLFSTATNWINRDRLLYSLILALLVTAFASPISYDQKASNKRKGRDLVIVLDTSGSMAEGGFDKENPNKKKFELLKGILKEFITTRYDDNIGVTIFGNYAYTGVPLTYDMKSIAFLLDFFDVGIAGDNTAIGEGIANAIRVLQKGQAKKKVIILITDGMQNSGSISIKDAAILAKEKNIIIYPIGIGDENSYDSKLLEQIADETNGEVFSAKNIEALSKVYKEIDLLEPSKIRSQYYLNKHSLYIFPLSFAGFLILYLLLKSRRITL